MREFTAARTPRNARRNLADRASADLHVGPCRPARAPAARQWHRDNQGRSRRTGDLPRPGPTRRVYAARPGARRARDTRHRAPIRARRDTMARRAGRGGLRKTRRPGVYTMLDGADAKIAALGLKVSRGLHLSRPVGQRCHGPLTLLGHRPLRLPRACGDAIARPRRRHAPSSRPAPVSRRCCAPDPPIARAASSEYRSSAAGHVQPARRPRTPPASSTRAATRLRASPSRSSRQSGSRSPNGYAFARRRRRGSTKSRRSCASTSCIRCARKPRARTSASASAKARRRS